MSSLEVRLKKLETLLAPPEPTLLEVLQAAYALREQRKAEAAQKDTPPPLFERRAKHAD
jgi:hypothetical protein